MAVLMISLLALAARGTKGQRGYAAHEWGTFTSVQSADGKLIQWKPLESSQLPGFVYNWFRPGFGRQPAGQLAFTKAELLTLQRMETPVIYFYANEPQTVNAKVSFPKGLITEWYPQATRIGPSTAQPPWLAAKLDRYLQQAGIRSGFEFSSLLSTSAATAKSSAQWAHVKILPKTLEDPHLLPVETSGSHYFAARETDANLLETPSSGTQTAPEHEKYLFYRGVGNFQTPVTVTYGADHFLVLQNTGDEPLSDIYVLALHNGSGNYTYVESLAPGQQQRVPLENEVDTRPSKDLSDSLGLRMETSLVKHGLYRREAAAMVHTWKDSWFEEDGVRVLYLLPRTWTDRTLPLTLEPEPRQLTRVMVGRAELLLPEMEQRLARRLTDASRGDARSETEVVDQLRKLNRFAEPALRLATDGAQPELKERAWAFLRLAQESRSSPARTGQ